MELVYLWVEEYKNIRNQGFNFSPRFEFHYNKDSKKLTKVRDESTTYKSIFPDNINITAIVGKNGTGKSSIQKLIFMLIFLKKYQNIDSENPENKQKEKALINLFKDEKLKDKNIFLIINTSNGLRKISLLALITEYKNSEISKFKISTKECCLKNQESSYLELKNNELDFFSIHFNYMIDTWYDDFYDLWTNSINHRVDGYDTPLLLEPNKGSQAEANYIDISNIEYLNNGKLFDFYAQITKNKHIISFFNPNYIRMIINSHKILNKYENFDNLSIDESTKKIFTDFINEKVKDKDLIILNKLYLITKVTSSEKDIFKKEDIVKKTRNKIINIKTEEQLEEFVSSFEIENLLSKKDLPETKKLEVCIDFHKEFEKDNNKLEKYKKLLVLDPSSDNHDNFHEIKKVFGIFNKIVAWIDTEFYDDNKSYNSLSGGEKMFLNFVINMMSQINNIQKLEKNPYKTINLFLDEIEFGLHPDWQKKFLNELLFILKSFDIKINLIYVTHSPYVLSDLPKQNVIFLDKDDKTGNCINVSKDIELKTFGANIHTLLSDGFFMRDGLMGEFAKSKITEILDFLNDIEELKTIQEVQIKPIIESIGEDFLREKLLKMYNKKYTIKSKDDEIEELKAEIERLKNVQN